MDLRQLRMFVAVAEHGSLTQAAERLNVSQPAASMQIQLLEQEFGVALFERKPVGLTLTQSGASLLARAQQILMAANEIRVRARSLRGSATGPIKLAGVAAAFDNSVILLGEMLHVIRTRHPELDILVYQRSSPDVWARVEDNEFDVGLAFGNRKSSRVCQVPLKVISYRVVAPGAWDADVCHAPWKELASCPWVTCPAGGKHHEMATQIFREFDCQPGTFVHGEGEHVITSLVMSGIGLGLMREELALAAQASGKVIVIDKIRVSTPLQLVYRVGRESDPAIRAILDVLTPSPGSSARTSSTAKHAATASL